MKEKFRLSNNRLQYLYYYKNKFRWLNIIYKDEKNSILNYVHYSNNHIKREAMDEKIVEMGYYWYGYSTDITELINKCVIYHSEKAEKNCLLTQK